MAGGARDTSAEIFDPNTGRFTVLTGHLLEARQHHGAALLTDGTVLIAGGLGKEGKALDTAEVFNSANSQFEAIVGWMGAKRINPAINQLPDGKVQVIGGDDGGTMEMYSPEGRFFRSKASLTLTAEMLPAEALLLAKTRSAYLDGLYSSRKQPKSGTAVQSQAATNQIPLDLLGYSATEIAGRDFAVIAGGIDSQGQIVRSVLVTASATQASVTTDRIDYLPTESPVITGSGWTPGESILIVRQQSIKPYGRTVLRGKADASGNFSNKELIPSDHQVGSYILTALGERSGFVAQTTYRTAPVLDPKIHYPDKPKRITFKIPLNGSAGSTETEVGTLSWKPKARQDNITTQSFADGSSGSVSLPGCLSLGPVSLCDGAVSVEILNSQFEINISADGDFKFDPGDTETGRLASFELAIEFNEELDAALKFRLTGSGTLTVSDVVLELFPSIEFELLDLEGELSAGLTVGVGLTLEPTTIEVEFNASQSHTLGANVSTATGFSLISRSNRDPEFSGGVTVIELGKTCLKFFVGPSVKVSLTAGAVGGSLGAIVDAFVEGCVTPTMNSTCEKYEISLDGGVEGSISGSLEFFEASYGGDLVAGDIFRANIFSFTHVAKDTAPPVFTSGVNDIQATADGFCRAKVNFSPAAEDTCSGVATITCVPLSGSFFPKGVNTVTCTATDRAGNSATASFTVTVRDVDPPVFAPGFSDQQITTEAGQCSSPAFVYPFVAALDNCDNIHVDCQPPRGTRFAKGVTRVTCTATDQSGNVATMGFNVIVLDKEKPKVTAPNYTASTEPGKCSALVNYAVPVATDNCPGVTVNCVPPTGTSFAKGVTTVNCTATDTSQNLAGASFTVTVNDNEKPTVNAPTVLALAAPGTFSTAVNLNLQVTDNCPGVQVLLQPASGSQFPVGSTVVTGKATDAAGNISQFSFTVKVYNIIAVDESTGGIFRAMWDGGPSA